MGLNRRVAGAALLVAAVVAGAGCDDGTGDADATSIVPPTPVTTSPPTEPPTTTAAPTSTAAPTTESPTTTAPPTTAAPTTAAPTTVPPSTTIDEEAVKAQIAADIEAAHARLIELYADPTAQVIDDAMLGIAAPGPYFDLLSTRAYEMVALGQRLVQGDPPINRIEVEAITLTSPTTARVTFCRVDNNLIVQASASPGGPDSVISPSDLIAMRNTEDVVLTERGWLISTWDSTADGIFRSSDHCA